MRKIIAITGLCLISAFALLLYGCGGGGYGGGSYGGGSSGGTIVTSIVISPATASVSVGSTQQFTAVTKNSSGMVVSGTALTWTSTNKAVATIDSNGLATAVSVGSTNIKASVTYNSGGVYGTGTTYTSNTATLTVTTSDAVMGTAATGHALAGALVTLKDGLGHTQTGVSDASGHFLFNTAGMQAPYLLKADDGRGRVLFGAASDVGVANIDTVTDIMLRAWYGSHGSSPEQGFADMAAHPAPDGKSLQALNQSFGALLKDALTSEGLDAGKFDLFATPFSADSTGFDAVLDHTQAAIGDRLQLQDGLMGRTTEIGFAQGEMKFTTL